MAFYGADRHVEYAGDFRGVDIFLIAEQDDHAGGIGQIRHQPAQAFVEEEVRVGGLDRRLRHGLKRDPRAQTAFTGLVNTAMADSAPKPTGGMRRTFDPREPLEELQEHILSKFLRARAVAQEPQREAEYKRLVVGKDAVEVQPHAFATGYYESTRLEIAGISYGLTPGATLEGAMPIYEYQCRKCGNEFELLVLKGSPAPACTSCHSEDIEQLLSAFGITSEGLSQARLKDARRRIANSSDVKDKKVAEAEYFKKEREEHGGG